MILLAINLVNFVQSKYLVTFSFIQEVLHSEIRIAELIQIARVWPPHERYNLSF